MIIYILSIVETILSKSISKNYINFSELY